MGIDSKWAEIAGRAVPKILAIAGAPIHCISCDVACSIVAVGLRAGDTHAVGVRAGVHLGGITGPAIFRLIECDWAQLALITRPLIPARPAHTFSVEKLHRSGSAVAIVDDRTNLRRTLGNEKPTKDAQPQK